MIIEQYGVKYTRITENDIELIRHWRNQSFIRDTMQFQEYITPQMQQTWFKGINNKYNYYFLIEVDKKKIGLINCKDTEPDTRIAEGGVFLWDKDYWGSPIAGFAALTMLECVFEIFKSGDVSIATVAKDNERAIAFNQKIGYEIKGDATDKKFCKLFLSKDMYFQKTIKLKRAARLFHHGNGEIKISLDESEYPLVVDEIINYVKQKK